MFIERAGYEAFDQDLRVVPRGCSWLTCLQLFE